MHDSSLFDLTDESVLVAVSLLRRIFPSAEAMDSVEHASLGYQLFPNIFVKAHRSGLFKLSFLSTRLSKQLRLGGYCTSCFGRRLCAKRTARSGPLLQPFRGPPDSLMVERR